MVLSHHPPAQYDRTLHVAGQRLCARCTGLVLGVLIGAGAINTPMADSLSSNWLLAGIAVLILSLGVIAFVLNESGLRRSNNYERILFGLIFGSLFPLAWSFSWLHVAGLVAFTIAGQFASAFALQRLGVLDRFFAEYFEGAMIWPDGDSKDRNECGRFFCACPAGSIRLPRG